MICSKCNILHRTIKINISQKGHKFLIFVVLYDLENKRKSDKLFSTRFAKKDQRDFCEQKLKKMFFLFKMYLGLKELQSIKKSIPAIIFSNSFSNCAVEAQLQ